MRAEQIRVLVRLEQDADAEAVLAAAEEALGRPVEPLLRFRTAPLLTLRLTGAELERVRRLPGVKRAEPEGRLPAPSPIRPGQERE
jgi:hypothetical protein